MSTLNPLGGEVGPGGVGPGDRCRALPFPAYFIAENKVTKAGKNSIAVAPDAKLLGGVILVLCAIGFLALWKRKRTLRGLRLSS